MSARGHTADVFSQVHLETPYGLSDIVFCDSRLVLLDHPAALLAEAGRMKNCLMNYWLLPFEGATAYAAWHGDEIATVELKRTPGAWKVTTVKGIHNTAVSSATQADIEAVVSKVAPGERTSFQKNDATLEYIARQAEWAKAESPNQSVTGLYQALQELYDSPVPEEGDRPFRIFEPKNTDGATPFIQFLADHRGDRRVLHCEIASHKYQPELAKYLDEQAFRFIGNSGFQWPRGQANFQRLFFPSDTTSLMQLAYFSLASLRKVFRVNPNDLIWISSYGAS